MPFADLREYIDKLEQFNLPFRISVGAGIAGFKIILEQECLD